LSKTAAKPSKKVAVKKSVTKSVAPASRTKSPAVKPPAKKVVHRASPVTAKKVAKKAVKQTSAPVKTSAKPKVKPEAKAKTKTAAKPVATKKPAAKTTKSSPKPLTKAKVAPTVKSVSKKTAPKAEIAKSKIPIKTPTSPKLAAVTNAVKTTDATKPTVRASVSSAASTVKVTPPTFGSTVLPKASWRNAEAKSSVSQLPIPMLVTPSKTAKVDPKVANAWKTKAGRELTDAELLAMPDSEYMKEQQQEFFKTKLEDLKNDLLSNAGETTEHLREDTSIVPDPADRATIEEEHALELRTRDRERKLLKKISQALTRLESGDYGYCDETGEPIGLGRLIARPTATLSLEAQQRRELKQRMFGD
jgi:DnaK suppressor protein